MQQIREPSPGKVSRRGFLEGLACSTAGVLFVTAQSPEALAMERGSTRAILIDTVACRNCGDCLRACAGVHGGNDPGEFWSNVVMVRGKEKNRSAFAVPARCMQCVDPACVAVCQGGALKKTEAGPVLLDQDNCVNCLWCIQACPFQESLYYDAAQRKVFKCDMCYGRIKEGAKLPCVEACDQKGFHVFTSGSFGEILQLGQKRARETDSVLLYPEETNTLLLLPREELAGQAVRDLFGFTGTYPATQARFKAGANRWVRFGWLPILAGAGFYVFNWRRNSMDELVRVRKEGEQP
jgi:Fe-S-cluster-containing dehydrogenase component